MVCKRLFRCLALICIGSFWGISAGAAEAPPAKHHLDLTACIEQALKANPRMEEASLEVNQAQWQLKSAKLARTPKAELFNLMGVVDDATVGSSGQPALTGDTVDGSYGFFNRLNVGMSLPLYTFGRLTKNIEAASENVNVQMASQAKATSDLVVKLHEAYYGLVVSRQLLDAMQELQKNFTEARDIAEQRLDKNEPSVTESDVLKLRVGLANVTKAVHKLERETQMAKEGLRRFLGFTDADDFDVADQILKPVSYELKPVDYYLQQAEANNPELKRVKAALAAEEARYQAEKTKRYPTLLAVGGVNYAVAPARPDLHNPFLNDDFNTSGAGGALALQWDLNIFQVNAEIQQKKVKYLKMRSVYDDARSGVALQVKDKYQRVKEKQDNLDASQESRKAGRGLLVLNLTNFKFGIGTGKDVFEALSLYSRTSGEYFENVFDYDMAVAELKSVTGELMPNPEKEKP
jgi:outer membrane protein